jgi:thymidylate synthase
MDIAESIFEEAYRASIKHIWNHPDYITDSRIGDMREIQGFTYLVNDPSSFKFESENIGRIDYEYANSFYEWMVSGSTDVESLAEEYPRTARFLNKPKSLNLPDNFNTFYGPRIVAQLPMVIKELTDNPNSRRAVISILTPQDLTLLDKDETLEFPCCDSATFSIREGRLNLHLHMRSQNMGQVLKLDMYLWGRFQCELAEKLNVDVGIFMSSVVSAHVFESDEQYLRDISIL